jgi:hypothetical protein
VSEMTGEQPLRMAADAIAESTKMGRIEPKYTDAAVAKCLVVCFVASGTLRAC